MKTKLVVRFLLSPAAALIVSALASEALSPLPAAKELPGTLIFHGHYKHRSRGSDIAQPAELWVNRKADGGIVALTQVPFMKSVEMVSGDQSNRPEEYRLRSEPAGGKPGYGMDMQLRDGKVLLTRRGVREDCDAKELAVPAGTCFDPNTRPDSYCAANILLRQFAPKQSGEAKEFQVYDWDNTGNALAAYAVKVELKGKEKVEVPAGIFEASHLVLTQTSTADTWFKKRAGQTTDFWVLENGVILRVLRNREPYELVLQDYDFPTKLPGRQ